MSELHTLPAGTKAHNTGGPRRTKEHNMWGPRRTKEHNIGGPEDQGTHHALKEHIGELVGRKQTHTPRYEFTSYLLVSRQMETRANTLIIQSPCCIINTIYSQYKSFGSDKLGHKRLDNTEPSFWKLIF